MAKTTFWTVIEKTLDKAGTPLSAKEIWDKANEWGTLGDFKTSGKTPWATISAYCYTDINNNGDNSKIIQTSERPAQFFLRRLVNQANLTNLQKLKNEEIARGEKRKEKKFNERDLHPLLVAFAYSNTHFRANLKTVFHENSARAV
ncbi:HTH domain-containing protein [Thermophagus xiamenensis]|uniref:HTH HARE-type domain-containing protein n=1 Tax=Thermophagus xiamenensis TaxID=385682 RepID=A0A1I2BHZ1_9BACT|nr:HTH domain-containing protein [Thermophagus xiamenensis]SFE55822.1 hypothetical protein SAMN05444380_11366 [Thermophagus xiamenensis]